MENCLFNGDGTVVFDGVYVYTGTFFDGAKWGAGILKYANGNEY
jgi:hypothetical protein